MWRSEEEMLAVVRQRAAQRQRRNRLVAGAVTGCAVLAVVVGVAAVAGGDGRRSEVRVAGGVEGGGASRGDPALSRPGAGTGGSEEPTTTVALPPSSAPDGEDAIGIDPAFPSRPGPAPPTTGTTVPVTDGQAPDPGTLPGSGPPGPDTPVSTVIPPPNGGPPAVGSSPRRVAVNPSAVDLRPRPFDSAEAFGPSSVAVRFWGGLPECEPIGRVDVEETATTVTITLYTGRPPGEPQACIAIAVYQELIVQLSAPLKGRTIVDGAA